MPEVEDHVEHPSASETEVHPSGIAVATGVAGVAAGQAARRAAQALGSVERRLRLARPGPRSYDAIRIDTLRVLIAGLGPVAERLADEALASLGSTGESVDVELRVSFPGTELSVIAEGLRTLDRAWRVAGLVAELDAVDLPRARVVSLDVLAPPATHGLSIEYAEVGSFNALVRGAARHASKAMAVFEILALGCGISGYTLKDGVHATAHTTLGQACQVQVVGPVAEPLPRLIQREIGTLPPGCTVDVDVVTGDGARITMHLVVPDARR
jgi:hypothetical protein